MYFLIRIFKKMSRLPFLVILATKASIFRPQDMIAQAQSGTGKTATFLLTMLNRVEHDKKYPQCICLAPTFELARQIGEVAKKMAKNMPDVQIRYAIKGETSK